jgi:hypothetical protein
MMLDPVFGRPPRGFLPFASLKRQVRLIDKLAEQKWPEPTNLGLVATVDRAHEFVAGLLGLTFGQIAGTKRLKAALSRGVVI